ncbi:PTS mannose/fructose/sorbose transporter subunit IIB [Alkalibaculum sp. M08DMB]|uniref:PTS mannose/fructose/sorbose transporter subunit IIB n=1 Tax=Alkalibaculum sporogenes TaxID=2655001 RepID=A0A6A7K933_9FIRM|nr:PTS sugar transporter subunit IIB [Alkalibaculum sporogenes]MPW25623.1 PTS mannose/fructose/sorbose transporter subunit IIB [Alkalibaculum sporogenes]
MKNIVLTRIDDRLIHGQVVTAWVKHTKGNRIIIVDDQLSTDSFMQQVLHMAAPTGIKVEVVNTVDASKLLKTEPKNNERIIILTKGPHVLEQLIINDGVEIRTIILGGIGAKSGRKKFYRNISIDDEELSCFKRLIDNDVKVFVQIVPDERAISMEKLI